MSYNDLKDCKIITAFITPFHEDGTINFDALPALIEHLLAHHTDGILLAGNWSSLQLYKRLSMVEFL